MNKNIKIHPEMFLYYIDDFTKDYIELLKYNKIQSEIVNIDQPNFWNKIEESTHFIYNWRLNDLPKMIATKIMPMIEFHYNKQVYPNYSTYFTYDDKIAQHFLLTKYNFPVPNSWIFFDKNKALDWIHKYTEFPIIFKLYGGAGSDNVSLVRSKSEAIKIINLMFGKGIKKFYVPGSPYNYWQKIKKRFGKIVKQKFVDRIEYRIDLDWQINKNYVLFQEFLPNNKFDTRIVTIGNRAIALIRYNRLKDFRASGSGLLDYNMKKISLEDVELCFRISKNLGFQSMAYDILKDSEGKTRICEISYTFSGGTAYLNCPGYWDNKLQWHAGHYKPQYHILTAFLNDFELKYPK